MKKMRRGILLGLIGVFFLSTYSVLGKILLENLTPETLAAFSQAFSVFVVLLFFGFFPEIKKIHKLPKKQIFWLFILAFFTAVLAPLLLLKGLQQTTVVNAVIVGRLDPVFSGIISYLWLREKITSFQIFGSLLMFFGIFFVVTEGFFHFLQLDVGSLYIAISAFFIAISTNIFKKYLSHLSPELAVFVRNMFGTMVFFTIIPFLFPVSYDFELLIRQEILFPLIFLALCTIFLGQYFWYKSLEMIPATKAAILSLLHPLFGVFLAVFLLKEIVYSHHYIGGIFVLAGLFLTMLHHRKHPKYHLVQKIKHLWH